MSDLIYFEGGWNGGQLKPADLKVGDRIEVYLLGQYHDCDTPLLGTLKQEIARHGVDHDHGHEYHWTGQDFLVEMDGDIFNRGTRLISLCEGSAKEVKLILRVKDDDQPA